SIQSSSAGMRQPLRLGQIGFASPQVGRAFIHLELKLVPGLAKRLFGPCALVDEARALKCCRSVIRSQAKQQMINLSGEVEAAAGGDDHAGPGVDTNGDDGTAARLDTAAKAGNDLHTGESAALGQMTFQPGRKRGPCLPPRGV